MPAVDHVQDDLQFVRNLVAAPHPVIRPRLVNYFWALYTVIGYTLIDVHPVWSGPFFLFGLFPGLILSAILSRRSMEQAGIRDSAAGRRRFLHWTGGMILAIFCAIAIAVIANLSKLVTGQVCVLLIGMVYYLAGVHFDRMYLILGPILMIGGLLVGFFPHYGWTALGVVIATGLVAPTFFNSAAKTEPSPAAPTL
jgi:hypothetical protein